VALFDHTLVRTSFTLLVKRLRFGTVSYARLAADGAERELADGLRRSHMTPSDPAVPATTARAGTGLSWEVSAPGLTWPRAPGKVAAVSSLGPGPTAGPSLFRARLGSCRARRSPHKSTQREAGREGVDYRWRWSIIGFPASLWVPPSPQTRGLLQAHKRIFGMARRSTRRAFSFLEPLSLRSLANGSGGHHLGT
jgi:hypothetical protein